MTSQIPSISGRLDAVSGLLQIRNVDAGLIKDFSKLSDKIQGCFQQRNRLARDWVMPITPYSPMLFRREISVKPENKHILRSLTEATLTAELPRLQNISQRYTGFMSSVRLELTPIKSPRYFPMDAGSTPWVYS